MERIRYEINGVVQGVGFRPFIYRLAVEQHLNGWVLNSSQGVIIEVEGSVKDLRLFDRRLYSETPPNAHMTRIFSEKLEPAGYRAFEIRQSNEEGIKTTLILPDLATCDLCQDEVFDPENRRYRYPFTNCTHCGPRYTIIENLPYDRQYTTMKAFPMCDECREEYLNPYDRRFHAQPNACPQCGPHLEFWASNGEVIVTHDDALILAGLAVRGGKIVAVKGLGGFHLIANARNEEAVQTLRERKNRPHKPFAVMFPDINMLREYCEVSGIEHELLTCSVAPIVLLRRKQALAPSVAPDNPNIGAFLPYTPLHQLLMTELNIPVIATSGNKTDEPICIDENEAVERLAGIADVFLVHNRPIVRPIDDSVVRVINGAPVILRRARGYAPLPIEMEDELPTMLAVGGQQKNTIALSHGKRLFLSQHVGNLETVAALEAFERTARDLENIYEITPQVIIADKHPDYEARKFADRQTDAPVVHVQHHYAHVLSGMAEHLLDGPVLGVAWDGTGYGDDGTIWGGEFLRVDDDGYQRVAHLRTFSLPGGEAAIKEPRRIAFALLYEIFGDHEWGNFTSEERKVLHQMLDKNLNSPRTSSAGRLFDAVSALLGLCEESTFEAQAAMALEFAAEIIPHARAYPFTVADGVIDWEPMVKELLDDILRKRDVPYMASRVHATFSHMIRTVADEVGEQHVLLTGGCFQNRYLTETTIREMHRAGYTMYWHQAVPPNDGGLSIGQLIAGARLMQKDKQE
ncbi:MAG: carbamoyltransferase HypF [Chloroflexi bacterium]|nr:carbamoyltransferase HypF [Chloroflexota bacterium]